MIIPTLILELSKSNDVLLPSIDNITFDCGECTMTFNTKHEVENHYKITHQINNQSFECPTCGKTFQSSNDLKGHITKKHEEVDNPDIISAMWPEYCHVCEKTFNNNDALTDHMNTDHIYPNSRIMQQLSEVDFDNESDKDEEYISMCCKVIPAWQHILAKTPCALLHVW